MSSGTCQCERCLNNCKHSAQSWYVHAGCDDCDADKDIQMTIGMCMAVSEAAEFLMERGDPYALGTDLKKLEEEILRWMKAQNRNVFTGKTKHVR